MSVESLNSNAVLVATSTVSQPAQPVAEPSSAPEKNSQAAAERQGDNPPMSVEQVQAAVDQLNELMQNGQRNLNFSVDKDTDDLVVKVLDRQTQEVIRQFPSEQALELAKHIEGMLGMIFDDRA